MQCRRLAEAPATRSATRHRRDRRLQNTAALHFDVALFRDEIRARPLKKMRRLAALIIGVATAQPVQNYYGNADPHGYHLRPVSRRPRALPYRPTYKPSLRGSDDDDCVDDEDWFYTTKEGDVFTCDRVAEKTKRCTIRFSEDGVRADEACKKTCGTCP